MNYEEYIDYEEIDQKTLELIGAKLKEKHPKIFQLFLDEFSPISITSIAVEAAQYPKLFAQLEKDIDNDLKKWLDEEYKSRKENSFTDEPGNYLKREV